MKPWFLTILLSLNLLVLTGQDCTIVSKANAILPNRLCSPLSVNWKVNYTGVNNAGSSVQIQYNWDDGTIDLEPTTSIGAGMFEATANHTYVSTGDKCNYRPKATLVVNGVICSSSTQEQIVTVWDDDNHNGGHMHISPEVYPICYGNGADVRFQDLTQFNCVPPQESDVPNLYTRWIRWIYGTDITMTGVPVTINGTAETFAYSGPVITLPGPVTGSGVYSDIINVADDKLIGQYFQVTLLNWNYCNPYDDPNIPGPPADPVNGDHPPVTTTAIILIVPYPDATITPVDTLCVNSDPVELTAHDNGGVWSGDGVSGDYFFPSDAGPGNHIISYVIADGNNCSDADQTTITVMPEPVITIDPIGTVYLDSPPEGLSASPPGGTWSGNGVYNGQFYPDSAGTGIHTIVYNSLPDSFGCFGSDSIYVTVILPSPPFADFEPDTTGCSPLYIQFRNNSSPTGSYLWDFGDNTYSTEKEPIHTYYLPGQYTVNLTVSNIAGQSSASRTITVYQSPTAVFTAYPENVTMNDQEVLFTNLSNNGSEYYWDFGDGTYSTEKNPGHIYDSSGVYYVDLRVSTDQGCTDTASGQINVLIYPAPVADFEPDTAGCTPMSIKFRNNSESGETYHWDFGDNTYSIEFEPNHIFNIPGQYTVNLTVSNIAGQSSASRTITVYQSPTAVFTAYPENVTMNDQEVLFTNLSNNGSEYYWDFGDGTYSTEKNPGHIYDSSGVYYVDLRVSTDQGCTDTASGQINVLIYPAPVADFDPDTAGCAPMSIKFRNNSESGETYLWDFGDKTYSIEFEPNHIFNIPGQYPVKLTVTNKSGQSSLNRLITVYQNPTALFSIYPTDVINNTQVVVFTNFSYYASAFHWNFGDGSTSTEESPWHKYELAGNYYVTLKVSTDNGCIDSLKYESPVHVDFKYGDIHFPNAFRWNGSGPTGGYWNDDQIDDAVFRPFFKNVIDYKLQVFNRWGVLIYESHDINKGWDGYFKDGNLAVEGVYVYKVSGQYADGRYFIKVGDVTFLH